METRGFINKYVHFSIDDVYLWLKELHDSKEAYTSMFQHPKFSTLKSLHDEYGAVITLNCFYTDGETAWSLDDMTLKYKQEFTANANWLRLAFHARSKAEHYNEVTDTAGQHYQQLMNAYQSFASAENIDTLGRTHYFSGHLENVKAWQVCTPSARGFLTSDDARELVLYLNKAQREILHSKGTYYDDQERLFFIKSMPRLESWEQPVVQLTEWNDRDDYHSRMQFLAFFTHEQCWSKELVAKINDVFEWAKDRGYQFAFPMDTVHEFK